MSWSSSASSPWNTRDNSSRKGILLGVLGCAILSGLGGAYWWASQRERIDAATGCPTSGPGAINTVVIDRSDPITPQQAQRIGQELDRLKFVKQGERVDIYVAEGNSADVLKPVFLQCNPGQGKDANVLTQNPERLQRHFEKQFASALDRTLKSLLEASTRPTSPIIESVRAAAISAFGPVQQGSVPLRLIIVSDMIQHSDAHSHFRGQVDFDQLSKSTAWRSLQPNLKGADVQVFYLLRPGARRSNGQPIQNRGHQLFWERAITNGNGRLVSMESV